MVRKLFFWGGTRLRSIRARRSTFIGFSKAAVFMACRSYRHPSQPGNSKAQNSPCDPLAVTSTDAVSNRHLNGTRVSWFITHARVSGGSATELSVTDECQGRSGDGCILLQPASCSVINIAHSPNKRMCHRPAGTGTIPARLACQRTAGCRRAMAALACASDDSDRAAWAQPAIRQCTPWRSQWSATSAIRTLHTTDGW
jgi:hypothetical protein